VGLLESHRFGRSLLAFECNFQVPFFFGNIGDCVRTSQIIFIKMNLGAGRQWLTSVVLATQESEIRRIKI
jgi:hypothetical protein